MRYYALACDYDGTLATDGRVDERTLAALRRLRASGRHLLLVTGRELDDLQRVFPQLELFELVVAENGGLLFDPAHGAERTLAEPPPPRFVEELRRRGVRSFSVGRVIVATWTPEAAIVQEVIHDLGLERQVIFNKDAVMVLPAGVNKSSGLAVALRELKLSPRNSVAVGNAENDLAMLSMCECGVAVENALPIVKELADLVTSGDHGAGVVELVEQLLADDLRGLDPRLKRHEIPIGTDQSGAEVSVRPYGVTLLLAGPATSALLGLASDLLQKLAERTYQYCILDPHGRFTSLPDQVTIGGADRPPSEQAVLWLLQRPETSVVVDLRAVEAARQPELTGRLLAELLALRAERGHPHWIGLDDAHELLPPFGEVPGGPPSGLLLLTPEPERLPRSMLAAADPLVMFGERSEASLAALASARAQATPPGDLRSAEALVWPRGAAPFPLHARLAPPDQSPDVPE